MSSRSVTRGPMLLAALLAALLTGAVYAAIGDLLATVTLPGNGGCSVGGAFDGNYYFTVNGDGCSGPTIGVWDPPAGSGAAALIATKTVKDAGGGLVTISALDWDSGRQKMWGAYGDNVYLIDIGDHTVTGDALATLQFTFAHGGIPLIDGLAYDASDDTVYLSPDVDLKVYHLSVAGALLHTVVPKNAAGEADGGVSGVAIGAPLADGTKTLYIGRDGFSEIRRIKTPSGEWLANFATTNDRVEDLVCDPVTYAPKEAILAKDAYGALYEAFEVEPGTCPLQALACTQGFWKTHPEAWTHLDPAAKPAWGGDHTYMQILWMPPRGDATLNLAHAYIAAVLNTGAPADLLAAALALLTAHPVGSNDLDAKGKNTHPDRAKALALASKLQDFNESMDCPLPKKQ